MAAELPPSTPSLPPSRPGPHPPPIVEAIDRLGEIAAVLVGGYLCSTGKLSGTEWMLFSGAVLGVQNSIRGVSARARTSIPPLSGVVALTFSLITLASQSGHA